jgi:hypothetical protein
MARFDECKQRTGIAGDCILLFHDGYATQNFSDANAAASCVVLASKLANTPDAIQDAIIYHELFHITPEQREISLQIAQLERRIEKLSDATALRKERALVRMMEDNLEFTADDFAMGFVGPTLYKEAMLLSLREGLLHAKESTLAELKCNSEDQVESKLTFIQSNSRILPSDTTAIKRLKRVCIAEQKLNMSAEGRSP